MTFDERVKAVKGNVFTDRQARFLVTVMLHSGVCMHRHYCAFARIAHGQKTKDFFSLLVQRKLATAYPCAHKRARIFHVHHRALYEAIGEPNNRFRKPAPIGHAVERLMLLDAVLASPEVSWLATERDKLAHFTVLLRTRLQRDELPHLTFGEGKNATVRYFPDKLPIGVAADGREHVFTYLVTLAAPVDFRAFLHRHAELLQALPAWRVRLLIPTHFREASDAYVAAWRQEFASPLRLSTADELRCFFEQQHNRQGNTTNSSGPRRAVCESLPCLRCSEVSRTLSKLAADRGESQQWKRLARLGRRHPTRHRAHRMPGPPTPFP